MSVVGFFAVWAGAAQGDFGVRDGKTGRNFEKLGDFALLRDWDVGHRAAGLANEMPVVADIRAIAGRRPLDIDLLGEAAIDQRLEAVVDCGQRNAGDALFGADENLGCGRVVALIEEDIVNLAALGGEAMTTVADRLLVVGRHYFFRRHGGTS